MTDTTATLEPAKTSALALFRRKQKVAFAVPAIILAYLVYIAVSFDVVGLAQRASLENASILASDTWSHKVHVTRDNRRGGTTVAIEGERKGTYEDGTSPDWVSIDGADEATIDFDDGSVVQFLPDNAATFDIPDFGTIEMQLVDGSIRTNLQEPIPDWINKSDKRITITTDAGRMSMTRSRTEVFRYFGGWELFWFTLDSPYYGHSFVKIVTGDRIDPTRSNISGALSDFWNNAMWRHKDVAWAMGETILMAFLGTFGAAMIALPLAFIAAKRFSPLTLVRASMRRVFDFVRGVDALIWTVVLARAFGPGPLTGALAILVTDTGTFGKTFSEALENVDQKQIDGVASTGAKPLLRYRFGVIPQVAPVLLAQVLYFLESNTRSATIIGAITGGGIGLMLTQAIQTQKDWEEVGYYIMLIIILVMFMDWFSGWLRGRLIGRSG
ncbi:phosphonate ABC transporter, permease protein PhnE [Lentibacter algarum]|uniref:phosphonate ABC transporter, permease protein PhnE n=1 Tax=Lentibacter algarum TaxID=576131 RepID=UPI001C07ABDF|nr:phosphonate ABC transporter, permease protein PhnE [Lentibacter algarum]MBU2982244.1 phosphonate ABC transporter, permease protein PhnE [Lentibacter algarum]